jgi:hypothetical protein
MSNTFTKKTAKILLPVSPPFFCVFLSKCFCVSQQGEFKSTTPFAKEIVSKDVYQKLTKNPKPKKQTVLFYHVFRCFSARGVRKKTYNKILGNI